MNQFYLWVLGLKISKELYYSPKGKIPKEGNSAVKQIGKKNIDRDCDATRHHNTCSCLTRSPLINVKDVAMSKKLFKVNRMKSISFFLLQLTTFCDWGCYFVGFGAEEPARFSKHQDSSWRSRSVNRSPVLSIQCLQHKHFLINSPPAEAEWLSDQWLRRYLIQKYWLQQTASFTFRSDNPLLEQIDL